MILSLYFQRHFDFLINSSHGYQTDDILVAQLYNHNRVIDYNSITTKQLEERRQNIDEVGNKLNECPFIEYWMNSSTTLWEGTQTPIINNSDEMFELQAKYVSADFFDLWGLRIVDGCLPDNINDVSENVIVLNEYAMKLLGYTSLENASVRSTSALVIYMKNNGEIGEYGVNMTPVSAVVQDYYMGHLTEGIKPMIFVVGARSAEGEVLIRVKKDREKEVIDYLRKVEKEVYNSEDFSCKWADDIVAEMYKEDKKTAQIYTVFSYIAIVISCLGLLGISLFDIRRRYREIAIRKVNGAKPKDLYILLGKNYMLNLLLAFVVAAPVSWIVIYYYTASFLEKAPVTFGLFVIPLFIVLILSMLTFRTEEVETWALNNVSIEVKKGEFVAIMGPSGCGKSTLLNILGLLDNPTDGTYYLNGVEVSKFTESQRTDIRKGVIGFVFQSFNLIDELNVYENIELPLLYMGVPSSERKKRVEEAMNRMDISHRFKHFPQQLSGGQQQRVAIARAVVANPQLILADEPTGNLDSKNGKEVMALLSELHKDGTTIVMVTHSRHDASYADRIINLFDGEVVNEVSE